jgi:hypothetical protein
MERGCFIFLFELCEPFYDITCYPVPDYARSHTTPFFLRGCLRFGFMVSVFIAEVFNQANSPRLSKKKEMSLRRKFTEYHGK